jgi:hypothetical protein
VTIYADYERSSAFYENNSFMTFQRGFCQLNSYVDTALHPLDCAEPARVGPIVGV